MPHAAARQRSRGSRLRRRPGRARPIRGSGRVAGRVRPGFDGRVPQVPAGAGRAKVPADWGFDDYNSINPRFDAFIRDHLFRPFASTKTTGYGIGMYQTRDLIERWGGHLEIESEVGTGTTARVLMPLAETRSDKLEEQATP